MRHVIILVFSFFVYMPILLAQSSAGYIRKGNKEYEKKKFYEAELEYRKAMEQERNSTKAQFNLGGALFRQEKYDETFKNYEAIVQRDDTPNEVKASTLYNIGNVFFKQKHFKESVEAYKQALRLNPGAKDIKYNLSAALRKLQQQNQENQKDDQNQQENNDQQKQEQQKQNNGGEGKQQNNEQTKGDNNKNEQDNNNNQDKQEQQQQNEKKNNKQQQNQQGNEEQQKNDIHSGMTQEDAAQLLKALENQESALQAKVQKAKAKTGAKTKTDKDW